MDDATHSPSVDVQTLVRDAPGTWSLDPAASVGRTALGMVWSPLKMAAGEARAVVNARCVRS